MADEPIAGDGTGGHGNMHGNQDPAQMPGKDKKTKLYIIGGLALVAVLVFVFVRKSNSSSSSSGATSTTAAASSADSLLQSLISSGMLGGNGSGSNPYSNGVTGPQGPAGPAGPAGPPSTTQGSSGTSSTNSTFRHAITQGQAATLLKAGIKPFGWNGHAWVPETSASAKIQYYASYPDWESIIHHTGPFATKPSKLWTTRGGSRAGIISSGTGNARSSSVLPCS
jgi:hypothetical protein